MAPKPLILIVDDDPEILLELEELLTEEGCNCISASGVDEAIEIFNARKPVSLVITDMKMPGKSGLVLINHLRQPTEQTNLPIILISGHGGITENTDQAIEKVNFHLQKPVDPSELIKIVEETLNASLVRPGLSP